jgi:O-antigen ligase
LGLALSFIANLGFNYQLILKNSLKLGILGCLALVIVLTNLGLFKEKLFDAVTDVKKVVIQEVLAETKNRVSDPGFIRLGLWQGTLKLIFSSPKTFFIGTGPETFPYEFPRFRVSSLNYSSEWDYILNKPHNYYLELWSQAGIFAVVSYLLIALRFKKNQTLAPVMTAFYVTNIFGWPTVSTAILFWVLLALVGVTDA